MIFILHDDKDDILTNAFSSRVYFYKRVHNHTRVIDRRYRFFFEKLPKKEHDVQFFKKINSFDSNIILSC